MTTDIAVRSTDTWVDVLPAVGDLAAKIATTDFVPDAMKGKPAAVAAAILYGREIGLGPMQSLQSISVIKGKPSLSAEAMRAMVLAAGHTMRFVEMTNTRCVVECRRAGETESTQVAFTMDDAKRMGLSGQKTYQTMPRQMLAARVTSEACRLVFPDVVAGFLSDVEARDGLPGDEMAAPAAPRRTVRRAGVTASTPPRSPASDAPAATVTVSVDEPPLDDEPVDTNTGEIVNAEVVESEPEQRTEPPHEDVTAAQMKMLGALLRTAGVEGREDALAYVGTVVGRDITSRNELTKAEASQVIDALNALVGDA